MLFLLHRFPHFLAHRALLHPSINKVDLIAPRAHCAPQPKLATFRTNPHGEAAGDALSLLQVTPKINSWEFYN